MSETNIQHIKESHEQEHQDTPSELLIDTVEALTDQRQNLEDINSRYSERGRPKGGVRLDVLTVGSGDQSRHVSVHWDAKGVARLALAGAKPRDMKYLSNAREVDEAFRSLGADSRAAVMPVLYAALSRHGSMPHATELIHRAEMLNAHTSGVWATRDGVMKGAMFFAHRDQIVRIDTTIQGDVAPSHIDIDEARRSLDLPEVRHLIEDGAPTARVALTKNADGHTFISDQQGRQVELGPDLDVRLERIEQSLSEFVGNQGFDILAGLYQTELPKDPRARLAVLHELAQQWNFRGNNNERQAVDWGDGLDPQVETAARLIGQVDSSIPTNMKPKVGLVLGAANKAPLDRTRYLRSVVDPEIFAYAGSSRPVNDQEREKAKEYARHPNDEFDLGISAFQTALGAYLMRGGSTQVSGEDVHAWRQMDYIDQETGMRKTAIALSTPYQLNGATGKRRATTYDNLEAVASDPHLGLRPGDTVVQATTQLYAPAQHLVALEVLTLGHGINVETVGHDAAYSGVKRTTKQCLQELKAAVDAAVHLLHTMDSLR